jgi:hypothetical protein
VSNFKLPHWLSTALVALCVALGADLTAAKSGALPVTPQVLGVLTILGGLGQYVLGLLSPSVMPTANLRAAKTAGLVSASSITQTMLSAVMFVTLIGFALAACIKPPTPAQQAQDAEALTVCIAQYFGLPVVAVAAACTGNEITVAEDAIADFEYGIEKATGTLSDAGLAFVPTVKLPAIYSDDVEIQAHLERLRAGIVLPPDAGH